MMLVQSARSQTEGTKPSKLRIVKNVVVMTIGHILLFTAFNGLIMLQSTMNYKEGIGVASQGIIFAGFCICSLLLPKYFIKNFGCKTTVIISMLSYVPYFAANFYPHWITMIPSAISLGLGAGLLWSSQCTYFNESSYLYSLHLIDFVNEPLAKKSNNTSNSMLQVEAMLENNECNNFPDCDIEHDSHTETKSGEPKSDNKQNINVFATNESLKYGCSMMDVPSNNLSGIKSDVSNSVTNFSKFTSADFQSDSRLASINDGNVSEIIQKLSSKPMTPIQTKIVASTTARFFGFHGLAFQSTDIWGNLMSYFVFKPSVNFSNFTNATFECGSSFCNIELDSENDKLLLEPTSEMRYLLTGLCVILGLAGSFLVFLFLDRLETKKNSKEFSLDLLMATCKFVVKREHVFLIPMSFYVGLEQAFYMSDFTKSYIGCAWGTYNIGLVTVCYGCSCAFTSSLSGWLVKYVGRIPILLTAAVINLTVSIILLTWHPHPDLPEMFFVASALWGGLTGIIWSQIRALYGILFKEEEEAAFAGFYLWNSLGYCLSFSYSNYICTSLKVYILLAISSLAFVGYLRTEAIHSKGIKKPEK